MEDMAQIHSRSRRNRIRRKKLENLFRKPWQWEDWLFCFGVVSSAVFLTSNVVGTRLLGLDSGTSSCVNVIKNGGELNASFYKQQRGYVGRIRHCRKCNAVNCVNYKYVGRRSTGASLAAHISSRRKARAQELLSARMIRNF